MNRLLLILLFFATFLAASATEILYSNALLEKIFVNVLGHDYSFHLLQQPEKDSTGTYQIKEDKGGAGTLLLYSASDTPWAEVYPAEKKINCGDKLFGGIESLYEAPMKIYSMARQVADSISKIDPSLTDGSQERLNVWKARMDVLDKQISANLTSIRAVRFAEYGNRLRGLANAYNLRRTQSLKEWLSEGEQEPEVIKSLLEKQIDQLTDTEKESFLRFFSDYTKYLHDEGIGVMLFIDRDFSAEMRLIAAKHKVRLAKISTQTKSDSNKSYEQIILELSKSLKARL